MIKQWGRGRLLYKAPIGPLNSQQNHPTSLPIHVKEICLFILSIWRYVFLYFLDIQILYKNGQYILKYYFEQRYLSFSPWFAASRSSPSLPSGLKKMKWTPIWTRNSTTLTTKNSPWIPKTNWRSMRTSWMSWSQLLMKRLSVRAGKTAKAVFHDANRRLRNYRMQLGWSNAKPCANVSLRITRYCAQ